MDVWGTGKRRREFLDVDDLADACFYFMKHYDDRIVNIGWRTDITMGELAEIIAFTVGFSGGPTFDPSLADGTPRKLLDTCRLTSLGWMPKIELEVGIRETYGWLLEHICRC